jgi:hypothetical protein
MEKFNEFVGHFNESIDQQLVTTATKQLALTRQAQRPGQRPGHRQRRGPSPAGPGCRRVYAMAAAHSSGDDLRRTQSTHRHGRCPWPHARARRHPWRATAGHHRRRARWPAEPPSRRRACGQEELASIAAKLEARSSQVSFKDLYTSVLALQATHDDHCPACDTPLTDTKSNPFEKATAGLTDLKELGELQDQRARPRSASRHGIA